MVLITISFSYLLGDTSTDWDKAWAMFKKKGKRTLFSDFSPDKYVRFFTRQIRELEPTAERVSLIRRGGPNQKN
jgi:hypothetical protein